MVGACQTGVMASTVRSSVPRVDAVVLEAWRPALRGYSYRMLGSPFEAEDAVQETLVRAWAAADQFDPDRGTLRGWLFRIATNVCLDMLRGRGRRARAMDVAPPAAPGPEVGEPLGSGRWLEPAPDALFAAADGDPEAQVLRRESIRLAFLVAVQALPARQRAVLLLRDVFAWSAVEVADLLDSSVASVNSALQRARVTIRNRQGDAPGSNRQVDEDLLSRYCRAFEAYDVDALIGLMREDVTTSMPPYTWWLRGRGDVAASMRVPNPYCVGARTLPVWVNGCPGFGQYAPRRGGGHAAFALVVLTTRAGLVAEVTTFLDAERFFPLFELPLLLP